MKTITVKNLTLTQAENYQNRLYNKYDHVNLVKAPLIGEADRGTYTWKIK